MKRKESYVSKELEGGPESEGESSQNDNTYGSWLKLIREYLTVRGTYDATNEAPNTNTAAATTE